MRRVSHTFFWGGLIFWSSLTSPFQSLYAQIICTGAACNLLPPSIQFQLAEVDKVLQSQYSDKVMETLIETAVLTNVNSGMIGPGIVNQFQVGAGITLSGQKKENIDIVFRDLVFRGLPNVGAAIAPHFNAAMNLGWLVGDGPSDTVPEYSSFLHRFNLYIHGFQYNFAGSDVEDLIRRQDDKIFLSGNVTNFGFMIRFHVFPNYSDGIGIFEFSGISLGTGLNSFSQRINILYNDPGTQTIILGPTIGTWGGTPTFNFDINTVSIPLDVRTGFRMFYFLTFFAGVGTSLNFGSANLELVKEGPLNLRLEQALVTSNLPPELQALLAQNSSESGVLSVRLRGKANPPNNLSYIVGGLEFNVGMFKILLEGMASRNIQSVNAGVKLAF